MYNPNNPTNKPTINGRAVEGARTTAPPRFPGSPGLQLGGGEVGGPQEAAERRQQENEAQRQKKIQEREERQRIEKERMQREEQAKKEKREKNVELVRQRKFEMEQDRKKKIRDAWDKSPSRSKSHQPPPPGAGPAEKMAADMNRRVPGSMKKRPEKKFNPASPETIDITDEDEELQLALQASLEDSNPKPPITSPPEVHDVDDYHSGDEKFYEDDEEMQKALMMSASDQKTATTTTPPTTNHPTTTTPKTTTTSTSTSSSVATRVYDVDGDVDMDVGDDPELQEALIHSLDAKPPAQVSEKVQNARTRIFGEDSAEQKTTTTQKTPERTRVYGVDDDDEDIVDYDSELQDALRLSRQVIDVDQDDVKGATRPMTFGGSVEDYPSPADSTGPVITSIDDDDDNKRVEGAEDEDEELQRALMSSLNPNASPGPPRRNVPARPRHIPQRPQVPEDPAVAAARRVRTEQDRAYQQSLAEDREKERKAQEEEELARKKKEEEERAAKQKEMEETARRELRDKAGTLLPTEPKEGQGITIGIRMPNGTRFMRRFNPTDTLQDLRYFIESKANESNLAQSYEITSDFPKKTFHDLPVTNTLAEAGISGRMLLNLLEK